MRSVTHVQFGDPQPQPDYIVVPIAIYGSNDDEDNEDLPDVDFTWINLVVTYENCLSGNTHLRDEGLKIIEGMRLQFTPVGYERMMAAMRDYFEKNDLSVFGIGYFADPESNTRH